MQRSEVYEDWVAQTIEAMYLIDKRDIERQEDWTLRELSLTINFPEEFSPFFGGL